MENILEFSFPVEGRSFNKAGDAAARVKQLLKQASIPSPFIRRAVVVAYEAELNMIIHSQGGTLRLAISPEQLTIQAVDQGPGIENLQRAMQEGYSTAPREARELGFGGGMGLSNIQRNADHLDIQSQQNEGTVLTAAIYLEKAASVS